MKDAQETLSALRERLNKLPDLLLHDPTPRGVSQACRELAKVLDETLELLAELIKDQ